MIEKMIPLDIPPGIVTNGSLFQRKDRWAGGNFVRFHQGVARAVRTFTTPNLGGNTITGTPIGAFGYNGYIAMATSSSKLYELENTGTSGNATMTDITPASFTGSANGQCQFDIMGTTVVACKQGGGIFSWTRDAGAAATEALATATYAMGVTPERFLLSARLDGTVAWASQGTVNTWTPASTNSAGSLSLPTAGTPRAIRRVRGQTLLWTTQDLWSLNYVGAPLYYGASLVANGAGLVASLAITVVDNSRVYWMTERGFKMYDGYVRDVQCPVFETIFDNLNTDYTTRYRHTFAVLNSPWNEIWWFYPSTSASGAADKVAIYNYAEDWWSLGTLTRTAGTDAGHWSNLTANNGDVTGPLMFGTANNETYSHEALGAMSGAYIESGPLMLDESGNDLVRVNKMVPDNVQTAATETLTLYKGTWPKVAETNVAYTIPTAGGPIDVRDTARYIRIKQTLTREDSRVGTWRAGVVKDAKR
jgi:hypothetical protein